MSDGELGSGGENRPSETPEQMKRRKLSLVLVYITNFLSACGFSVLMTTMALYLRTESGSTAWLGYVIAAFSIGQVLGAPFWGYLYVSG